MMDTQSEKQPPTNTVVIATGFDDIRELGDRIAQLRLKEAKELTEYITRYTRGRECTKVN